MARSARASATASTTPNTTPVVTPAPAGAGTPGPVGAAAGPSRRSTRRSLAAAPAPSAASTPVAAGSPAGISAADPSTPSRHGVPKSYVEPKAHGLRNASNARDLTPCPYPGSHGGNTVCGVSDDDLADDVLMAICSACAALGNLALSPDELAAVAFEHGWLRPPSIAVAPATMIQNAIRMHQSRCAKATPPRKVLLTKYQLAGSTAEAVLAPALHPNAFDGPTRPKGPVWYLSPDVGRAKWRNPFAGIVVLKAAVRKPAAPRPPRPVKPKSASTSSGRKDKNSKEPSPADESAQEHSLPRIKLRVSAAATPAVSTDADASTAPSTPGATVDDSDVDTASRVTSRSMTIDSFTSEPAPQAGTSLLPPPLIVSSTPVRKQRPRKKNVLDSSDSESSDSDDDVPVPRQRQARRIVLPPSAAGAGSRIKPQGPPPSRQAHTPLGALFFSPVTTGPLPLLPVAQASPFPHHSLDNTIWAARNRDLANVAMDASSSSSDDDLCDDWGTNSGLMIKGDDDELLPWPQTKEEDPTLRAATTAMRSLFAIEEGAKVSEPVFNQLDNNRTTSASDPSSLTDTASTLNAVFQGKLKNAACPAALPAWALSSPVSSPNLVGRSLPAAVEASPTQYLSRVARDYDRSMQMDVDVTMDESWLDESGQLPVHAEDTFSDVEFGSTGGDLPHPECERHLQTAVWAQQQSTALLVKQEPEEFYSSPAGTSSDDVFHESRESSASALSPSSGSELTPYEYSDCDLGPECLVGPESIGMDELDDWLPVTKADRTPLRGRRARNDPSCCSGSWGGIGVIPPQPKATPPPMVRKRSLRSCSRRNNRSTPRKADASAQRLPPTPSPMLEEDPEPELEDESDIIIPLDMSSPLQPETIDIDLELEDAIGADELEQARIEAEAREEEYRAQKRCEAEENRRRWQAYRRAFADAAAGSGSVSPTMIPLDGQSTPWLEGSSSGLWSSTDSVADLAAPACLSPLALQITPVCSAELTSLNPKALLSPLANMMVLDSVLSQADMDVVAATLPPPQVPVPPLRQALAPAPAPAASPAGAQQSQSQTSPPQKKTQPQPVRPAPGAQSTSPRLSTSPKVGKRPIAPRGEPKKIAPKQILPRPDPIIAPKPLAPAPPAIAPAPPAPAPAPAPATGAPTPTPAPTTAPASTAVPIAPAPATTSGDIVMTPVNVKPAPTPVQAQAIPKLQAIKPVAPAKPVLAAKPPVVAPKPAVAKPVVAAPAPRPAAAAPPVVVAPTAAAAAAAKVPAAVTGAPTPATTAAATAATTAGPTAALTAAPTPRTVSPPTVRPGTVSPAISSTSTNSSVPSRASTPSSSGGTTKRLLPGIDACVIDNLPCYSHVYELPSGKKCTVLRRLDTDFVNGTALLTAIGVAPEKQIDILQAPGPTVQSHRSVPLISPQGQQHAAGVPGVWIPLLTARDLARKLGLPDNKLLSNILREDLFELFKELAGISLRHTTSTEFGVPFVTQPHLRKPVQGQRPMQRPGVPPHGVNVNGHVNGVNKGPLVRGPAAPPDGAPNAKRRRSVVGSQSGPQPGTPAGPVRVPAATAAAAARAAAVRPIPVGARPAMGQPGVAVAASAPNAHAAAVPRPAVRTALPTPTPGPVAPASAAAASAAAVRRTRASIGAK